MNYNKIKFIRSYPKGEITKMPLEHKRLTFVVTPELEPVIDKAKKIFYNYTQSDMIRTLIIAGLDSLDNDDECQESVHQSEDFST